MTNNPTIDGVLLKRGDRLFHRGNGRNCDRGWVEYLCDEGCGDVRVRHREGAVPCVKLADLQWQAMTDEEELQEFYSELSNGGKLSKRALCHVRALQSTIARLEARITQLESEAEFAAATYQAARDRIAELESGRSEAPFYISVEDWNLLVRDDVEIASVRASRTRRSKFTEPLFTAPPAPVAVVLPERKSDYGREWNSHYVAEVEGWNACLDATAALNGPAK